MQMAQGDGVFALALTQLEGGCLFADKHGIQHRHDTGKVNEVQGSHDGPSTIPGIGEVFVSYLGLSIVVLER